jgi:hypothetical protein
MFRFYACSLMDAAGRGDVNSFSFVRANQRYHLFETLPDRFGVDINQLTSSSASRTPEGLLLFIAASTRGNNDSYKVGDVARMINKANQSVYQIAVSWRVTSVYQYW